MLKYRFSVVVLLVVLVAPGYELPGVVGVRKRTADEFLRWRCDYYGLPYEYMKAIRKLESNDKPGVLEWRNGKVISYGLFQISRATAEEYYRHIGRPAPRNIVSAVMDTEENQEIACYTIAYYWLELRDWNAAVSAHNLGLTGLAEYRKRTGHRYYSPYVDGVEKRLTTKAK